jgi:hypothetical protein
MTELSSQQITVAFLIEKGREAIEKYINGQRQQLGSLSPINSYQKQAMIEELIKLGNKVTKTHREK